MARTTTDANRGGGEGASGARAEGRRNRDERPAFGFGDEPCLAGDLEALWRHVESLEAELAALRASRSWRVTAPLRAAVRAVGWSARNARRGVKLLAWLATGQASRTVKYTIPYYRTYTPAAIRRAIPARVRRSVRQKMGIQHTNPEKRAVREHGFNYGNIERTPKNTKIIMDRNGVKILRSSFRNHLAYALYRPVIKHPYSKRDKYFISFMRSYENFLCRRYEGAAQSARVSIIMPTFNRAHCISDAIRSVLSQSYENWELIIVDDGSRDGTQDVVSAFEDPRITYIALDRNLGAAAARNAAVEPATGQFVTYLDSDNTIEPHFLLVMANVLEESPDVDMVYCAQRGFETHGGVPEEVFVRFAPFNRPSLENRNYIDLGVIMHRRALFEEVGTFEPRMQRFSDWDFILRCTGTKMPKPVPAILSNYFKCKRNNRVSSVHASGEAKAWVDAALRIDPVSRRLGECSLAGWEQLYSHPYAVPEPSVARPVSIVIPSYEAEAYLRACVASIDAFCEDDDVEIIIVDNASGEGVRTYLDALAGEGRATVVRNERNLGFTHAVNQGLEMAATNNDAIIMNNDAIVTRGWLGALQAVLDDHPNAGLIVPTQTVPAGQRALMRHRPERDPHRECDINISAHHANVIDPLFAIAKGYMELAYAPFFCTYIPRATLDEIGPLDVENGPHYRSDRLYCDMIREVTRKPIIYTPHSKVYHFVQRATSELKERDAALYGDMFVRNDWSAISGGAGGVRDSRDAS